MKLSFWPSKNIRTVHCRRGKRVFREREVPAGTNQLEYPALSLAVIELIENGCIVGYVETHSNPNKNLQLIPTEEFIDEALQAYEDAYGEDVEWSEEEDDDDVLEVGTESGGLGATLSGAVSVSVSSVDEGDARQRGSDERGSESGTDGVHSDPAESKPVHDRREEGIGSVPSSDEDPRRDGLLVNEVRSTPGDESASSGDVQRREERGDKKSGDGGSVYPWKQ